MPELSLDSLAETTLPLDDFAESIVQPERPLSNSMVGSYLRCPMTTYWRYFKNVQTPPAAAMSFGTSIHKALEYNFTQKVHSRQDVPLSVTTDVFRDSWKGAAKTTVFDPEKDESPEEMLDQGVQMISKYHTEMAPRIQPKSVETKFSIKLPGVPQDVIGYIDLIDESEVILDHKTSKMTPKPLTLAMSTQMILYKMAYRKMTGHNPAGLRFDYLLRKTSRRTGFSVEIVPMPVQYSEASERDLIETFKTVAKAIRLRQFYPNTSSFTCSPMGCGFWQHCRAKILANEPAPFLEEIKEMQKKAMDEYREIVGR